MNWDIPAFGGGPFSIPPPAVIPVLATPFEIAGDLRTAAAVGDDPARDIMEKNELVEGSTVCEGIFQP